MIFIALLLLLGLYIIGTELHRGEVVSAAVALVLLGASGLFIVFAAMQP